MLSEPKLELELGLHSELGLQLELGLSVALLDGDDVLDCEDDVGAAGAGLDPPLPQPVSVTPKATGTSTTTARRMDTRM